MSKKRTRREKENVHHPTYAHVKRQINIGSPDQTDKAKEVKRTDLSAQEVVSGSIKRNIIKSLILISFILCLELVVYSLWNVK